MSLYDVHKYIIRCVSSQLNILLIYKDYAHKRIKLLIVFTWKCSFSLISQGIVKEILSTDLA